MGLFVYLAGEGAAGIGQAMLATALGWDLYERGHSAFLLGLVGLVQFIPVVALVLVVGTVVDRRDRRVVLACALGLQLLAEAGLVAVSLTAAPLWSAGNCWQASGSSGIPGSCCRPSRSTCSRFCWAEPPRSCPSSPRTSCTWDRRASAG